MTFLFQNFFHQVPISHNYLHLPLTGLRPSLVLLHHHFNFVMVCPFCSTLLTPFQCLSTFYFFYISISCLITSFHTLSCSVIFPHKPISVTDSITEQWICFFITVRTFQFHKKNASSSLSLHSININSIKLQFHQNTSKI
jgi:hypothetical protein